MLDGWLTPCELGLTLARAPAGQSLAALPILVRRDLTHGQAVVQSRQRVPLTMRVRLARVVVAAAHLADQPDDPDDDQDPEENHSESHHDPPSSVEVHVSQICHGYQRQRGLLQPPPALAKSPAIALRPVFMAAQKAPP